MPLLAEIGVRCRYENDPQPIGQLLGAMGHAIEEHRQSSLAAALKRRQLEFA